MSSGVSMTQTAVARENAVFASVDARGGRGFKYVRYSLVVMEQVEHLSLSYCQHDLNPGACRECGMPCHNSRTLCHRIEVGC